VSRVWVSLWALDGGQLAENQGDDPSDLRVVAFVKALMGFDPGFVQAHLLVIMTIRMGSTKISL
jgi:hypothetical protein